MCERGKSLPAPHKWRIQHGLGFNSACPRALDLLNGKFWRCNLANYALKSPQAIRKQSNVKTPV